jgi:hypothetical protein
MLQGQPAADGKVVIVGTDQVGDVSYGTFVRLLLSGASIPGSATPAGLQISNFDVPTARRVYVQRQSRHGLTIRILRTAC